MPPKLPDFANISERLRKALRLEHRIVVIGLSDPPPALQYTLEDGVAQVLALKEQGMRLKDAAKEVAEHTGLSKNELYAAALER